MFPGVDAEAVESADSGKEDGGGKKRGTDPVGSCSKYLMGRGCRVGAGKGGDEDGGGEEDADGEFLGKAAGGAVGLRTDVDEEHPGGEQRGEQDVEVEGAGIGAVKESG